jgi:hypothetical protein
MARRQREQKAQQYFICLGTRKVVMAKEALRLVKILASSQVMAHSNVARSPHSVYPYMDERRQKHSLLKRDKGSASTTMPFHLLEIFPTISCRHVTECGIPFPRF